MGQCVSKKGIRDRKIYEYLTFNDGSKENNINYAKNEQGILFVYPNS